MKKSLFILAVFLISSSICKSQNSSNIKKDIIETKVDSLLSIMTIEEKIGQMNQYNGFWEATGSVPEKGNEKLKYDHLRKGYVGSMLNITGVENVRKNLLKSKGKCIIGGNIGKNKTTSNENAVDDYIICFNQFMWNYKILS